MRWGVINWGATEVRGGCDGGEMRCPLRPSALPHLPSPPPGSGSCDFSSSKFQCPYNPSVDTASLEGLGSPAFSAARIWSPVVRPPCRSCTRPLSPSGSSSCPYTSSRKDTCGRCVRGVQGVQRRSRYIPLGGSDTGRTPAPGWAGMVRVTRSGCSGCSKVLVFKGLKVQGARCSFDLICNTQRRMSTQPVQGLYPSGWAGVFRVLKGVQGLYPSERATQAGSSQRHRVPPRAVWRV